MPFVEIRVIYPPCLPQKHAIPAPHFPNPLHSCTQNLKLQEHLPRRTFSIAQVIKTGSKKRKKVNIESVQIEYSVKKQLQKRKKRREIDKKQALPPPFCKVHTSRTRKTLEHNDQKKNVQPKPFEKRTRVNRNAREMNPRKAEWSV